MKTIMLTLSVLLPSLTAAAGQLVLQPPSSPFAEAPFAQAPDCHVQGINATGASTGVCKYHGYNSVQRWALASWDASGTPLSATSCYLYSYQGSPICPAQTFGPLKELSPGVYVFEQGSAAGVTIAITDQAPRRSVLLTP